MSGYKLYYPPSTIDNGDGTTSTSYTTYPTLSDGTNTITYDETSFAKSSMTNSYHRSFKFKLNGKAQSIYYVGFVVGGDYATEHSSTSYNLYKLITQRKFQTLSWHVPEVFIINSPRTKGFFNTPSAVRLGSRYTLLYNDNIGRHILYLLYSRYQPWNGTFISYNTGIDIPTISELYSA